jgi:predicted O-methyltransferase YrrM
MSGGSATKEAEMKAYCINLNRRTDRRTQFESMCRRAGVDVERFPAIDGFDVELPHSRGEGDRGIYGSLLSHMAVIQRARDLGLPEVMVFEDDAVFPEWFLEETNYFFSIVPADWGMIYFGGHGWPRRWSHVSGPVLRGTNIHHLECYVVRNTAYDRVIDELERTSGTSGRWADQVLRDLQAEIPTYTMLNPIVGQCADYSDNFRRPSNYYDSRCDIPGWFTDAEGAEYLRQVRRFDKPTVAELGTFKGRSASFIAEPIHRRGGMLYCVDLWDCEPSVWGDFQWWMNATGLRHCALSLRTDSAEAASFFPDEHFDLVFHDADHSYDAVKREIQAWRPKVRSGGVIMGHDYTDLHGDYPGVKRAVHESFGDDVRSVESLWICEV